MSIYLLYAFDTYSNSTYKFQQSYFVAPLWLYYVY